MKKRIVILDGCTFFGVCLAEAIRHSPKVFGLSSLPIVLLERPEQANNGQLLTQEKEAMLSTLSSLGLKDIRGTSAPAKHAVQAGEILLQTTQEEGWTHNRLPVYEPEPATDLFLYGSFDSLNVELVKKVVGPLAAAQPDKVHIICFASHAAGKSQVIALQEMGDIPALFVRAPYFATAATYQTANLQIFNPIESFCLGVALGVTRVVKVAASQPVDICPIDLALNAALTAFYFQSEKKLPANIANPKHLLLDVVGAPTNALVWGMVGEYIQDYYCRNSALIHKEIPSGLFDYYPSVLFKANLPDLWNYGLSLSAPAKAIRNTRSNRIREHLKRFPHAATVERMKGALTQIDTVLDNLPRFAPAGAAFHGYNPKTYSHMIRLLSHDRGDIQSLLFNVDLDRIEWEGYVKRIAVQVLHYLTEKILNHTGVPINLPEPRPYYNNSFIFKGDGRAPDFGFRIRRIFPGIYASMRAGQQPNGGRVPFHPGSTQQRRVGIVAQPHVQFLISKIAKEQNLSKELVEQRAHGILLHVGDTLNHQSARALSFVLRNVMKTLYHRVNIGAETFNRFYRAFNTPRRPVVVIPTHRSYVDFLVMSYALMEFGMPIPHICSGEDFLGLGAFSEMLRGSGAFFMRRSFKNDKLYGALFKEYVRHLARDSQCIEFFTEGTRSRVQKTLTPKFGVLKMITDALLEKQEEIDDVILMPVSFSYERILEGNVYAKELLGVPKPKETFANLLKSASILKDDYGALNVVAGEPISVAEYAAKPLQLPKGSRFKARTEGVDATPVVSSKSSGGGESSTPAYLLNAIGWRLHHDLQENIIVTPTALLASVLLCFQFASLKEGVPVASVSSNVEWVRAKVLKRGQMNNYFASSDGDHLLKYAAKLLDGHVRLNNFNHLLVDQESIATQMLLQMYTNQLIHLFYDEGCACVAAFSSVSSAARAAGGKGGSSLSEQLGAKLSSSKSAEAEDAPPSEGVKLAEEDTAATVSISEASFKERCRFFKDLLCMEFVNFTHASPIAEESWMEVTLDLLEQEKGGSRNPVVTRGSDSIIFRQNQFSTYVTQLMYPSVDAYYVVLLTIYGILRNEKRAAEDLLAETAHQTALLLSGRGLLDYVTASSKEGLKNAFTRYKQMGVVMTESAPSLSLSLRGNYGSAVTSGGGGGKNHLLSLLDQVNEMRWHPTQLLVEGSDETAKPFADSLEVVKEVYARLLKKKLESATNDKKKKKKSKM